MKPADTYAERRREAEEQARAILREHDERTPAEQAAIAALADRWWVLWHADDHNLGVVLLLSRADLLRDKEREKHDDHAGRVNAELAARDRQRDAVLISTLDAVIEQAAERLDKGDDPVEVTAWLRKARAAAIAARDRRDGTDAH